MNVIFSIKLLIACLVLLFSIIFLRTRYVAIYVVAVCTALFLLCGCAVDLPEVNAKNCLKNGYTKEQGRLNGWVCGDGKVYWVERS